MQRPRPISISVYAAVVGTLICGTLTCAFVAVPVLAQSGSAVSPIYGSRLVAKSAVSSGLSKPDPARQAKVAESYGKLPLSFEINRGQADSRVKFLSRTSGYSVFLTGDEAVLALSGKKKKQMKPRPVRTCCFEAITAQTPALTSGVPVPPSGSPRGAFPRG